MASGGPWLLANAAEAVDVGEADLGVVCEGEEVGDGVEDGRGVIEGVVEEEVDELVDVDVDSEALDEEVDDSDSVVEGGPNPIEAGNVEPPNTQPGPRGI